MNVQVTITDKWGFETLILQPPKIHQRSTKDPPKIHQRSTKDPPKIHQRSTKDRLQTTHGLDWMTADQRRIA